MRALGFGGGSDKEDTKTLIKNTIDTEIKTRTENLNKLVNESSTIISTEMVQKAIATVINETSGANIISAGVIRIGKKAKVKFGQNADVKATNDAILKIVQDATSMQQLGNKMASDIANKVQTDQQAKQNLDALAKIGELTKSAGGAEGMLNSVTKALDSGIKSITGAKTEKTTTTEISNALKTMMDTVTINSTNIQNIVKTEIKNKMEQAAEGSCKALTSASNIVNIGNLTVDEEGEYESMQAVTIESFNKCLIDLNMGTAISNKLTADFSSKSTSDTSNKQASDSAVKADNAIVKETIQESAIMDSVDNTVNKVADTVDNAVNKVTDLAGSYIYIIGAIVLVVIIGSIYLISKFLPSFTFASTPEYSDNTDNTDNTDNADNVEQEGGENILFGLNNPNINSNIYLFAAITAMIIFSSRKSIPLCGVFLVVVFLYFIYKKNPNLLDYINKI